MNITCCYKCDKRYIGCHAECDAYIEQRAKLDTQNKLMHERYKSISRNSNGIYTLFGHGRRK